jgi:hypothetical protein
VGVGATNALVVNNAGLVGIGTNAPAYTLDVSSASAAPFRVGVGATNALVVNNTGLVGIGTNAPAYTLDVSSASAAPFRVGVGATNALVVNNAGNVALGSTNAAYTLDVSSASSAPFRVGVGATNAIVVNNTGYVGIGTTAPATALDVTGNIRCTAGIDLNYTTIPTYSSTQLGYTFTYTNTNSVAFNSGTTLKNLIYFTITPGTYILFGSFTTNTAPTGNGYSIIAFGTTTTGYDITYAHYYVPASLGFAHQITGIYTNTSGSKTLYLNATNTGGGAATTSYSISYIRLG